MPSVRLTGLGTLRRSACAGDTGQGHFSGSGKLEDMLPLTADELRRLPARKLGSRPWESSLLWLLIRRQRAKVLRPHHLTFVPALLRVEGMHNPG
jgi:hypothetical protein